MTCKDFSGMIPDFFNDRLENAALRGFLDHYQSCDDCREELEIQYLVDKVFSQLEVGEEINISKDLPAFIDRQQRLLKRRVRLEKTALVLECTAVLMAVITAVIYML